MKDSRKVLEVPLRDFAMPVPRTGSIDALSGYGRQAQVEGQEIHLRVQKERAAEHADYQAEVTVEREFERAGYVFRVRGRMDGFFPGSPPRIEEIKSTFAVHELGNRLAEAPDDHPYNLQLRTYGYFHWLEHGVEPSLSFHLVSTRKSEDLDLAVKLDREGYERWLERRLDELVEEARRAEARGERRRKLARNFAFPFERPRPGQTELIETLRQGLRDGTRMLVQAPTGLGKTVGVLYPALQDALARGQRAIYVTPKNSQHSVAEDAVDRFKAAGSPVKSLTMTAKSKICFKAEPLCNPEYCEYAKDHYTKVSESRILEKLARKRKLTTQTFRELGEEHQVCPFELQLDAAAEADVVICDYNYVFAPRSSLGRLSASTIGQEGKPNLVIDEAHNLPARAMDYYSPALSSLTLERMREELRELPGRFAREAEEHLDACLQVLVGCRPPELQPGGADGRAPNTGGGRARGRTVRIEPPAEDFREREGELRSFLSRYLESDVEIRPRDPVLRLCFYWGEFTAALEYVETGEREEFFTTYQAHPTGGTVKITCCDASPMLQACYDEYDQVVAFSATLKPFDYYAKLSGLDPARVRTAEFTSPFPRAHRKLLVIPQVSTKYAERERSAPRIAEAIARIAAVKPGNYFAFFPSFEFLEKTWEQFIPPSGFGMLKQERDMKPSDHEAILEELRSRSRPTIVFAVQGGVFSEGVDYPGDMIIGAFIVGPPLPSFDLEREQLREYYEKHYRRGFDYAYAYPAMAKAVQAAGRVIRSESDRGIIVLLDDRFLQSTYAQSMPTDWFGESPRELVSSAILKDVQAFWEAQTP